MNPPYNDIYSLHHGWHGCNAEIRCSTVGDGARSESDLPDAISGLELLLSARTTANKRRNPIGRPANAIGLPGFRAEG
jgi:hypothetical protein